MKYSSELRHRLPLLCVRTVSAWEGDLGKPKHRSLILTDRNVFHAKENTCFSLGYTAMSLFLFLYSAQCLIIYAERRRYWDIESCPRRVRRPRVGALLLRPVFRSIRQTASPSLIFVRNVLAVQDKGIMRTLLHFVSHVACLWQRQKNGLVGELDGKQCARLLPGCLAFQT